MLQGGLRLSGIVAAALFTAACAGVDGTERGAIRENVIEPGITGIDQSKVLACNADLTTLRTALETYELLEGSPAPDEATLVEEQFLRSESELWDIDDGRLVPTDPACGSPQDVDPDAVDIVTSTEPPLTADEMFADLTADDIAAMGGEACARQLIAIFSGVDRFLAEQGREPDGLDELAATGYLSEPVTLWVVTDETLMPADGSDCNDFMTN
jgi:hypothetical protein